MSKKLLIGIVLICLGVGGYHAFKYHLISVERNETEYITKGKYEEFILQGQRFTREKKHD